MLVMGTAGAWADSSVDFNLATSSPTLTNNPITLSSSNATANSAYWEISAGGTFTLTAVTDYTITGATITFTEDNDNRTGGGSSATVASGYSYSYNSSTHIGTITASSAGQTATFTCISGKKARITAMTVTYKSGGTTYSVTYDGNGSTGGSVPTDATSYSSDATVTVKGNTGSLVKTNYYFNGWNSKADGTGANFTPAGTFSITKDTTLYAKWTAKTKTDLAVSPTSGSVYVDKTKNISSLVSSSSDGAVTYYSSDTDVATVNSSTGVVTGEAAGSATITISQAEDSVHLAGSTTYTVTVNAAPTQYTVTLGVSPAGAGTATAVYGTGGDDYNDKSAGDEFVSGSSVSKDIYLTLTASAGTGYHFDTSLDRPWGGGTSLSTASGSVPVGSDKEYVAHFAPNTYTITLDKNGGSADGSATATYASSTLSVTDATHATKTLTGYYTAASGGTKVINADGTLVASTTYADGSSNWKYDGNVTLYAQWYTPDTYTVTYNANLTGTTGSVPTDGNSYAEDATVTVLGNTGSLAKTGYTFLGWSTASGYQSSYYAADATFDMGTANVTLYAQWKLNSSLVSSSPASGTVATGGSISTTASSPVTGMYLGQSSSAFTADALKATTLRGTSFTTTMSSSDPSTAQILSVLLTDGTFFSDVVTSSYTVGVATPVISCSSNRVTISSATDGVTIRYTDDGTTPSASTGTVYDGSFAIAATKTIKAIAYKTVSETTYSSSVASETCTYSAASTALPVTFDFSASPFSTSTDFSGAQNANTYIQQDSHNIYFHGTTASEYSIESGSPNSLQMGSNGATNHFIAIPISGINGRIDIDVWAPFASSSTFTVRAVLDTDNGTTVQTSAPSTIAKAALDVNKYDTDHFNFRITDITATSGVLYIGRASSSYKNIEKIYVYTPANYLVPAKTATTIGDNGVDTIAVANYTSYNAIIKSNSNSSVATATFNPSTGKLAIAGVAPGTTTITLVVDEDGDGEADDEETKTATVTVTVHGITVSTQPASDVYKEGGDITALSVTATHTDAGTLKYQWYKNTVNSTTGGEKVGTNSASYTPSLTAEANAFYYCEVSVASDTIKSHTTDVAYVLYSSTKRYFQMSNVAGNRQTSDDTELITGEVIAGGSATAVHGADSYYRYITRPNTSVPHMYVTTSGSNYFKIDLDNAIVSGDLISVLINGYLGSSTGIKISTDAAGSSNVITIDTESDTSVKTYTTAFTSAYNGLKTVYVRGIYGSLSNYFTDLIFSTPEPIEITGVTPTSQTVGQNATATAFTVSHTGGNGTYTYQWYTCNSDGSGESPISDTDNPSYIPSTTSTGSTYYKVTVTSNGVTRTSSVVRCEVVASIDYYVIKTNGETSGDAQFDTDGEYEISGSKLKTVYTDQADASRNCWYLNNSTPGEDLSGSSYFEGSGTTTTLSMKSSGRTQHSTFYVQGAVAVKITSSSSSDRKYDVTIDGESQGTYSADSNPIFTLNKEGSVFKIDHNSGDVKISGFIFYEYLPNEVTVSKDGETVTETVIYLDDSNVVYNVEGLSSGTFTATSSNTGVVTVSDETCTEGNLTLNPVATGTATITITQVAGGSYGIATTTLSVKVKTHTLALAFSYDKASFKASALTEDAAIASGSLPTLTATLDGEEVTGSDFTALGIKYTSDDTGVGYFDTDPSTTYTVKYGGGQGGARIYAYVDNRQNANVSSAKAYFDLVVENGTSNTLPNKTSIDEQKVFSMANSSGVEVVRLTYGGYKYKHENGWADATSKGSYYIDGYPYYTRHNQDALDEYGYQLRGMTDEPASPKSSSDYTYNTWSNQNVGSHSFWYTTSDTKPGGGSYSEYERIRPFTLPCRGGYLKFEPKQTGKLTVYVWQNGQIEGSNDIGSKPRLGYWFDQDGWVQHPVTAPVTKQPITNSDYGSDTWAGGLLEKMTSKWTAANGDDGVIEMLLKPYCNSAKTEFSGTKEPGYIDNPYYWMTSSEITTNLDEEATIISTKMTPTPYHNGYLVPQESYLKYVLNVVAGKTYYFYGMMTKVGYVGMNFVQDEVVDADDGYTSVAETLDVDHQSSRHLNATDDMSWVSGLSHDYTVYDEVTLPSSYKKNKWYTICLPFALSENQVEEAFGKGTQLAVYNGLIEQGGGNYTIKFLSHVDQNILPGQPYLIKPSGVDASGDDLDNVDGVIGSEVEGQSGTRITFSTVCIDKTHFSQAACNYGNNANVNLSGVATGNTDFKFTGTYSPVTPVTYSYIMSKSDGILKRWEGTSGTLATYHAYVKATSSRATGGTISLVKGSAFENTAEELDNEPTAVPTIEEVAEMLNNGSIVPDGRAYNMMGQEIDPTAAKGMVIMNGKKYMLK